MIKHYLVVSRRGIYQREKFLASYLIGENTSAAEPSLAEFSGNHRTIV
ncbi:MAG: hypothetical protein ABWY18_16175 [Tardiphaga sp.]